MNEAVAADAAGPVPGLPPRVAVTGGAGQLGALVLERLLRAPGVEEVRCLDRRRPPVFHPRLRAIEADVRDPGIGRHFEGAGAVVHLAFLIEGHLPRERYRAVNVEGSRNVFEAAAAAGAGQLVYSSSAAAYGAGPGDPLPLTEDSPRQRQAEFSYAAAKYDVEELLDGFETRHPQIAVTRLRPAILVGERMANLFGRHLRRRRLPALGSAPLPLVWDEDVADAALRALERRAAGAFNLMAGEPLPPAELAAAVGIRTLRPPRVVALAAACASGLLAAAGIGQAIDPAWIAAADVPLVLSCERARQVLGWRPRYPTATEVMRHYLETVPERLDRRVGLFLRLADLAGRFGPRQSGLLKLRFTVHVQLTGRRGGDFAIVLDDGRARLRQGRPAEPAAVVRLPVGLFLDLLAGRSEWGSAFLTGRIRSQGEGHAPMVVGGLVAGYRARKAEAGLPGRVARMMSRWIESGGVP